MLPSEERSSTYDSTIIRVGIEHLVLSLPAEIVLYVLGQVVLLAP